MPSLRNAVCLKAAILGIIAHPVEPAIRPSAAYSPDQDFVDGRCHPQSPGGGRPAYGPSRLPHRMGGGRSVRRHPAIACRRGPGYSGSHSPLAQASVRCGHQERICRPEESSPRDPIRCGHRHARPAEERVARMDREWRQPRIRLEELARAAADVLRQGLPGVVVGARGPTQSPARLQGARLCDCRPTRLRHCRATSGCGFSRRRLPLAGCR